MHDDDQTTDGTAAETAGEEPAVASLDFLGEDLAGGDAVTNDDDGSDDDAGSTIDSIAQQLAQIPPPKSTTTDGADDLDLLDENIDQDPELPEAEDSLVEGDDELADDDQLIGQSLTQLLADFPPPPAAATAHASSLTQPISTTNQVAEVRDAALSWASRWQVDDDPYIMGITDAIGDRENLTSWAAIDPYELLPYPEPHSGRGLRRLTRVILVLRNVTVFVPVALTWFAINKATSAYGPYLDGLEPGASTSFLEFWQSGGADGTMLDSFWRVQHVAFLAAIIIAGIVSATLLVGAFEARSRAQSERQESRIELERRALALEITVGLQGSKSASPASITEALALALGDLIQATRDLGGAAARMEAASVGIDSLNPRIADLNIHAAELGRSLTNDVNRAIDDLGRSVATLGITLGGDMQRFLTDALVGLEEINDRLSRTSVSVEFGTKQLRDDLDAMHGSLSQLIGRRP